jgi:NAD(P)-dependent dehydrogenase (short-subunit alcohol dehydrogenase family)
MVDGHPGVAVVTGGASGIGREIAVQFAGDGTDVVVADRRPDPREGGRPTHERIEAETGARATYVECDVTVAADLVAAVEAAEAFGGVDAMVNNAGVYRRESLAETSEESFRTIIDVNVTGTFFGAKAAADRMVEGEGGIIVNMSSIAGLAGVAGEVAYCASKGAVRLMTYALADELGPDGVRVNAVHPGTVETSMTTEDVDHVGDGEPPADVPLRRFGRPADVANAVRFLASDEAAFVTGESFVVDGGASNTL